MNNSYFKDKVIIITGCAGRQHAREAVGQGAYDFFRKPIVLDEITVLVRRALHVYQLEQEYRALQRQEQQAVVLVSGTVC